ncbi:MAG: LytR/AlgR family response regulator transcription factor [Phascolarctobacterium sp.]
MLRFLLCDDDKGQLTLLQQYTQQWAAGYGLEVDLITFNSGTALLAQYAPRPEDIAILDIIMPDMDGLELARKLRAANSDFSLIFLTSSQDFALAAYEVHPYGYLLKPADYASFSKLLDSLYQKLCQYIVVKSGNELCSVSLDELAWVEAVNRQVVFNLANGKKLEVRDTFNNIQLKLSLYPCFFKPHRSYIVNFKYVERFNTKEITMRGCKLCIPLARGLDKEFKDKYFSFMFS